jgi:blue copper oxidase
LTLFIDLCCIALYFTGSYYPLFYTAAIADTKLTIMKRRDFVSVFSASLGATVLWSCRKDLVEPMAERADFLLAKPGVVVTRYPLKVPAVVAANGQVLDCKTATTDIGGGKLSNVWTYNGDYPARTLVASTGSNVDITMINHLPEETITHWHGMIVDHMNDGGPMLHVPTGGSQHYNSRCNKELR